MKKSHCSIIVEDQDGHGYVRTVDIIPSVRTVILLSHTIPVLIGHFSVISAIIYHE